MKETRDFIVSSLGGKCACCGFMEFNEALQAHHLDPKKKDPDSRNMKRWGRDKVKAELKKCVLLCAICHIGVHVGKVKLKKEKFVMPR